LIAQAAGVHMFIETTTNSTLGHMSDSAAMDGASRGCDVDQSCSRDGIEAAGTGLLLRGGTGDGLRSAWEVNVSLPFRPDAFGWNVVDADTGIRICEGCHSFMCSLGRGLVRIFHVTAA
jgi:hypothetical protein